MKRNESINKEDHCRQLVFYAVIMILFLGYLNSEGTFSVVRSINSASVFQSYILCKDIISFFHYCSFPEIFPCKAAMV